MCNEFKPLRFPSAESWACLTELEIAQACVAQRFQGAGDSRHRIKIIKRFIHAQFEYLRDVLATILDVQRLAIKTASAASLTADKCRWQKIHFQLDRAGPITTRTTALLAIEREPARRIPTQASLRDLREQFANLIEKANVGCRSRT